MKVVKKIFSQWSKAAVRRLYVSKQANRPNRNFPDFIIVGAQKSGTSSLYSFLSQHTQLIPSYHKEVHFFDGGNKPHVDNFKKGPAWYQAQFPLKRTVDQRVFEASPLYLFNRLAARRIFECIPEVKLIAVLRNPVERAISHYFHVKRKGREPLPLMEALQAEGERLQPLIDRQDYNNSSFIYHSYIKRGMYYEQLKRYFDCFPKDNILVLNSEAFFRDPDTTLQRIFQFVGVHTDFAAKDLRPHNVGSNRTKVDPEVYAYLEEYFYPHNQKLYGLVGQDYGW